MKGQLLLMDYGFRLTRITDGRIFDGSFEWFLRAELKVALLESGETAEPRPGLNVHG